MLLHEVIFSDISEFFVYDSPVFVWDNLLHFAIHVNCKRAIITDYSFATFFLDYFTNVRGVSVEFI